MHIGKISRIFCYMVKRIEMNSRAKKQKEENNLIYEDLGINVYGMTINLRLNTFLCLLSCRKTEPSLSTVRLNTLDATTLTASIWILNILQTEEAHRRISSDLHFCARCD